MKESIVFDKSKNFALRIIALYKKVIQINMAALPTHC